MFARLAVLISILFLSFTTGAQTFSISGRSADRKDTSYLIGVTVILKDATDTSLKTGLGAVTDADGKFELDGVIPGTYLLHLEYSWLHVCESDSECVTDKGLFGRYVSHEKATSKELKGVTVTGKANTRRSKR